VNIVDIIVFIEITGYEPIVFLRPTAIMAGPKK
jgi:hypothetical protein